MRPFQEDGEDMNATASLRDLGQSLWLDNISRALLHSGTLEHYVNDFSVTGVTSNPTIFDHAVSNRGDYDTAISEGTRHGRTGEALFFDLALDDITQAADLLRAVHDRTGGVDGWVSLEVSPSLARDAGKTIAAAKELFARAARPNVLIKIPGTPEGIPAIEEAIFAGVPINVTLLFSAEQYLAAAEAYLRGIERRIADGLDPVVHSVASVFVSRWDVAVASKSPEHLHNKLGIAVAQLAYGKYQSLLCSPRWQRASNFGARTQRLLWASTGTKDPRLPDTYYVDALAAPLTVNTMPDATLVAYADHGRSGHVMSQDQSAAENVLREFSSAGVDVRALATQLQNEGAASFVESWTDLMDGLKTKTAALSPVGS